MLFVEYLYEECGSGLKFVIISFKSIWQLGFGEDWSVSAMRLQCRSFSVLCFLEPLRSKLLLSG